MDWHISKFVQFFLSLKSLFCAELNQWSLKINKLATNYISKWTSSASSLSGFQSQQSLSSTNLQFTFQHCVNSSIWTWSKTQMALKMLKKHQTLWNITCWLDILLCYSTRWHYLKIGMWHWGRRATEGTFLSNISRLQLIQNSVPSITRRRQCDIRIHSRTDPLIENESQSI